MAVSDAAIKFLVFEDNGGDYHWTILDSAGESLAQSVPFATHDDAARAARIVCDGARSARLEMPAAADRPVDFVARREAALTRDDSDPGRWLDEGGSFGKEDVTS